MIREVILVEVVNKPDMSTEDSKTFTKTEKAESYFVELLKKHFGDFDDNEIEEALDNGYYDSNDIVEGKSAIIKEISFEED